MFFISALFQEQLQSYNIEYIIDTSHLLVGINSAANFFLYLILRKNFRAATWRILSCKPQPVRPSRASASVYHNTTIATTAGHSRIQGNIHNVLKYIFNLFNLWGHIGDNSHL